MEEGATILLVTVIATVVGTVLALEAWAWVPHLSRQLLHRTIDRLAEQLPADQAARWGEEIEADFESYGSRRIGGLVFAVGLRLSGGRKLLEQLSPDSGLEPDSPDLQASPIIPTPRLDPPVPESASMITAEAPFGRVLMRYPFLRSVIEHRRQAMVAIGILSFCMTVALEILEEREQG